MKSSTDTVRSLHIPSTPRYVWPIRVCAYEVAMCITVNYAPLTHVDHESDVTLVSNGSGGTGSLPCTVSLWAPVNAASRLTRF